MRHTIILAMLVLGAYASVLGQDRISKSVYEVGDTLYRAEDRLPNNPRLIRANVQDFWDFTGLMAPYVRELHVRSAANSDGGNSNERLLSNGKGVEYKILVKGDNMWITGLQANSDKYAIVGHFDQNIPLRVNTATEYTEGAYSGRVTFNLATEIVAALEDRELSLADSIRVIVDWHYLLVNDQKGQLQMESGLFDVIRQKTTKSISTQTEIKQRGMWIVVSNPVPIELPEELQTGTTFGFWSTELADPIAVVETDESENAVQVSFSVQKHSGRRVVHDAPSQPDIFVHPNPSFGMVRFDLVNLPSGNYQLEIYNILGVRLRSFSLEVDGSVSYPANLSDLKKGTYIYRLVDSFQKTLRSKRIVIITP